MLVPTLFGPWGMAESVEVVKDNVKHALKNMLPRECSYFREGEWNYQDDLITYEEW